MALSTEAEHKARTLQVVGLVCLGVAAVALVIAIVTGNGPWWALPPLAIGLALLMAYHRAKDA